jgi:hypothetical protein
MKARAALLWGVIGFFCVQAALDIAVVARHPELDDQEFAQRLEMLRQRQAEEPGRPLLLLLGSSRTVGSFLPEKLPPLRTATGERALPFNFSHLGAGPGMNGLELHRLLRNGIRPDWLVVEVMPPQLGDEKQSILTSTANVKDLSITRHYLNPWRTYGIFFRGQLVPSYKYRRYLARHLVPGWIPDADMTQDRMVLSDLGGDDSWQQIGELTPAQAQEYTAAARAGYFPPLQDLQVVSLSDRAMRDLLELCRRERIPVALLLTPEGREFQSWYAPESRQRVDRYCADLSRDYDVPLIDARDWLD